MSVVGGSNVLYENNHLENNLAGYACVYIAQENPYATYGAHDVVVQRNTLKNCGSTATGHGAVMLYSDGAEANTNITLTRNDIYQIRPDRHPHLQQHEHRRAPRQQPRAGREPGHQHHVARRDRHPLHIGGGGRHGRALNLRGPRTGEATSMRTSTRRGGCFSLASALRIAMGTLLAK